MKCSHLFSLQGELQMTIGNKINLYLIPKPTYYLLAIFANAKTPPTKKKSRQLPI